MKTKAELGVIHTLNRKIEGVKRVEFLNEDGFDWNKWLQIFYLGAALAISRLGLFWE